MVSLGGRVRYPPRTGLSAGSRKRGRPARTKPGTAPAVFATGNDRQQHQGIDYSLCPSPGLDRAEGIRAGRLRSGGND